MGPVTRYLGPDIPKGPLKLWQDPVPDAMYQMIDANDIASLKSEILNTQGLNISVSHRCSTEAFSPMKWNGVDVGHTWFTG